VQSDFRNFADTMRRIARRWFDLCRAVLATPSFRCCSSFNLSLQYEFASGLLVEAAYAARAGCTGPAREYRHDSFRGRTRRPYHSGNRPLNYVNDRKGGFRHCNNWYHSVNFRVERRFSKGLPF